MNAGHYTFFSAPDKRDVSVNLVTLCVGDTMNGPGYAESP